MFTMLQVIGRCLVGHKMSSIFFAADMLVVGVMMLNIVIAALLNEFLTTMMKVR